MKLDMTNELYRLHKIIFFNHKYYEELVFNSLRIDIEFQLFFQFFCCYVYQKFH